jgi:hypothetical protein
MTEPTDPYAVTDASEAGKVIDLSVTVVGTPEQAWTAIATGPGVSSWYVPTTIEERPGGRTTSRFGPGDEMLVPGRITGWDPPRRVVFDGGPDVADGLAFEWLVQARDDGTCVVRLVNSGFGSGQPWDDQYDAMADGWRLFLYNLQLHLEHFAGQAGTAMLPMAVWPGAKVDAWARLTAELGVPAAPSVGDRLAVTAADTPPLAGTVVSADSWRIALLLDEPAPGTAILAAEGYGDQAGVSVWLYLYGPDAGALVGRDEARWAAWLASRG